MLRTLLIAASFGLQFNPVSAILSAAVAAAAVGYPGAPRSRWVWAAVVLAVGWMLGDGISVAGAGDGAATALVWSITGFVVGYVAPAATGAFVGRRVVRGTGWLAAAAVAVMLASALVVLADAAAGAIWRIA